MRELMLNRFPLFIVDVEQETCVVNHQVKIILTRISLGSTEQKIVSYILDDKGSMTSLFNLVTNYNFNYFIKFKTVITKYDFCDLNLTLKSIILGLSSKCYL